MTIRQSLRSFSRVLAICGAVSTALLGVHTAHAEPIDGAVSLERAPEESHQAYLSLRVRYRQNPTASEASNLVAAGSRSSVPQDRLESARLGRKWLRDGALSGAAAERVRASVQTSSVTLGRIALSPAVEGPVRIDDELVEPAALREGWDVLPGRRRVAVGQSKLVVLVTPGERVVIDPTAPEAFDTQAPSSSDQRRSYWPEAKLASEATLVLCAATGLGAGAILLAAPLDDLDDGGGHGADDSHRAVAVVGVSLGAACLVGAVLVPVLWRNVQVPRTLTPRPHLGWSPFGVVARF